MILAIGLISMAVLERLVFDLGPNAELVTAASIVAGMYLPRKMALWVPLIIMAITDSWLGVSMITLFTWSGFAVMPVIGAYAKRLKINRLSGGVAAALGGVLWFYVWTNGGVWLTDSFGMYQRSFTGLIQCYVNGLPFVRTQLLCSLISVPVVLSAIEVVRWLVNAKQTHLLPSALEKAV